MLFGLYLEALKPALLVTNTLKASPEYVFQAPYLHPDFLLLLVIMVIVSFVLYQGT